MTKFECLSCCLFLGIVLTGCGTSAPSSESTIDKTTVSALNTKAGFDPQAIVDGDLTTGWVGGKKASESSFQYLTVDFGKEKTFSSLTLDDTFTGGYTNKKPDYVSESVSYNAGDASSLAAGSGLSNVLNGSADGQSWKSEAIPTASAPEWIWLSLASPVAVTKLELNNEMNNSVSTSFELYASKSAHNRREKTYTDTTTYDLLKKEESNTNNVYSFTLEQSTTISDLLLKIYHQENEGAAVVASLDEILFYGPTPADYHEDHEPIKFAFMGSNDGKSFDMMKEVGGNYESRWSFTNPTAWNYRYVRYVVFEEANNNYPSLGELIFA